MVSAKETLDGVPEALEYENDQPPPVKDKFHPSMSDGQLRLLATNLVPVVRLILTQHSIVKSAPMKRSDAWSATLTCPTAGTSNDALPHLSWAVSRTAPDAPTDIVCA